MVLKKILVYFYFYARRPKIWKTFGCCAKYFPLFPHDFELVKSEKVKKRSFSLIVKCNVCENYLKYVLKVF